MLTGKVWDATYGLLEYFTHHGVSLGGKIVVELGSGTGLAGAVDLFLQYYS